MAGLLAMLGAIGGPKEDGTANLLTRMSDAMHTDDALRRRAAEYQDKLAALSPNMDFSEGVLPNLGKIGAADPTALQDYVKGVVGSTTPSGIKEYQYFTQLPPEQQEQYLRVKRAQQVIDTGSNIGTLGATGQFNPLVDKTLAPADRPDTKRDQAAATEVGKELGVNQAELANMEAIQPQLEEMTTRLGDLAELATYTDAGQAKNSALRQLGAEVGTGATARAAYISLVDNSVLPLLRQIFGAQFTVEEGKALRDTLGNVDLSPAEKKAALNEFIKTKRANIETKKRATGQSPAPKQTAPSGSNTSLQNMSLEELKALREKRAQGAK